MHRLLHTLKVWASSMKRFIHSGIFSAKGYQPTQISALLNPIWGFDPSVGMPTGAPGGYNV